jgi:hypothetical protein
MRRENCPEVIKIAGLRCSFIEPMMTYIFSYSYLFFILLSFSCNHWDLGSHETDIDSSFIKGQFGYDLHFLKERDSTLIVLKNGDAQVIISPKYQSKVFTSTATGGRGLSFGWINYKAFGNKTDAHMNAYGGENRLWLGPEGGKYSLFFKPDSTMNFENWKTPSPFDTESWNMGIRDSTRVFLFKEMSLVNYAGFELRLRVDRRIEILDSQEISKRTGITAMDSAKAVGYETENILTNKGDRKWTAATGMPCIWILDMFNPSPATVIIVPFLHPKGAVFAHTVTTNYFGEIPPERLKHDDSLLYFKADGKNRGKLGVLADKAKNMAGSYDGEKKVLTIIQFEVDGKASYLNQEWNITKPTFTGDAVNAYNDGPLSNGTQMGPFYEMESVSPAAFLVPGGTLTHRHSVFHFTGTENDLNKIAVKLLGVSLEKVQKTFAGPKS